MMKTITLSELKSKDILEGDLFLPVSETRQICLLKSGSYLSGQDFEKYDRDFFLMEKKRDDFSFHNYLDFFRELKKTRLEKEKKKIVIKFFKGFLIHLKKPDHFFSFSLACFHELNQIPRDTLISMNETDINLFRHSFYSSPVSVLLCLANDFYEFSFLQDMYHLCFLSQLAKVSENYNFEAASNYHLNREELKKGREIVTELKLLHFDHLIESVLTKHSSLEDHMMSWDQIFMISQEIFLDKSYEFTFEKISENHWGFQQVEWKRFLSTLELLEQLEAA